MYLKPPVISSQVIRVLPSRMDFAARLSTALLDRLQHIFKHPGPNPPGVPDSKVLEFVSRIEKADPNSPSLSEDDKDAGDMYLDLLIERLWDLVKDLNVGGRPEEAVRKPGGGTDGTGLELVQGLTVELLKAWISKNPAIVYSSKCPKKPELVSVVLASKHIPTAADIQLLQSEVLVPEKRKGQEVAKFSSCSDLRSASPLEFYHLLTGTGVGGGGLLSGVPVAGDRPRDDGVTYQESGTLSLPMEDEVACRDAHAVAMGQKKHEVVRGKVGQGGDWWKQGGRSWKNPSSDLRSGVDRGTS
ncbi:hypothetical protein FA15DRAFT_661695 [Coprinopsis marcescibilis]|uniref:Uncharacterized protein n=1 Tax=Coprinopsis marcescibilis TaxID=230819 RepID=A0A5C3KB74_COPMA|nr:hypothetical protein FA15DRAFT_661695 [Coprinopsis marcescibilis]